MCKRGEAAPEPSPAACHRWAWLCGRQLRHFSVSWKLPDEDLILPVAYGRGVFDGESTIENC